MRKNPIEVCGKMVLLRFDEVKRPEKSKKGIILPGGATSQCMADQLNPKPIYRAYVAAIGPEVDLEKINFKVGDWVIYNDYDCKTFVIDIFDRDSKPWGITKTESIWGKYTIKIGADGRPIEEEE